MADKALISRFSPNRTSPDVLEAILVQRQALLTDTIERIEESATGGGMHHLLFIGPRGCGKTHLVTIINHRLEAWNDDKNRLRVAWLREDETSTSFFDFLLRVYRSLAATYPDEFRLDEYDGLFELSVQQAQTKIKQLILKTLNSHTLVILVENLDELFHGIGRDGQRQWRAFLQEHPVSVVVATSQRLLTEVRRQSPFFGFFQIQHLNPLSLEEATELLQRIARYHGDSNLASFLTTTQGRARIHAVYHLSGGNHRVYIILSEFISREALNELVAAFERMLDELTPYYQERMRWLTAQQRKLVDYLCRCDAPVPVKDIAKRLFISHQTASSQLKELRDKGYAASHPRGRTSLYELAEPLMRLCVEVKENRFEPIRLIVRFLRAWYSPGQLSDALGAFSDSRQAQDYLNAALAYQPSAREAISSVEREVNQLQKSLDSRSLPLGKAGAAEGGYIATLQQAARLLLAGDITEAIGELTAILDVTDATTDEKAWARVTRGVAYGQLGETNKAIEDCSTVIEVENAPENQKAFAQFTRGVLYGQVGETLKAIGDYSTVIEMADVPTDQKAQAQVNRGLVYHQLGETEKAFEDCSAVIEMKHAPADQRSMAQLNRGVVYEQLGEADKWIEDCSVVIEMEDAPRDQKTMARFNRGIAYGQVGETQKAIEDYSVVIEMEDAPADEKARAQVNRAVIYRKLGETKKAIEDYTTVIGSEDAPADQKAIAQGNRGIVYRKLGKTEKEIEDYSAVIEMQDAPADQRAKAQVNRGVVYDQLGETKKEIEDYSAVIEMEDAPPAQKAMAQFNRGAVYGLLGEAQKAIEDWSAVIEMEDAHNEHRAYALTALAQALPRLGRWREGWTALRQLLDRFPPEQFAGTGNAAAITDIIAASTSVAEIWIERIRDVVAVYKDAGALPSLGSGLVRSLADKTLPASILDSWHNAWASACAREPDMRIPLRIFKTGIRYLNTHDPRVLYDLVKEERQVLAEVLSIDLDR